MPRDFDELDEYENPHFRWVSMIVLALAVAGFLSLAWYAYQTGADHALNGEVVVIEAGDEPIKEVPEDRGGMDFPHQDKTIYNVLRPEDEKGKLVTVIEAPEEPAMPTQPAQEGEKVSADRKIAQIIQKAVEDTQRDMRHEKRLNEKTEDDADEASDADAKDESSAEAVTEEPKDKVADDKTVSAAPINDEIKAEPVKEPEPDKEELKTEPVKEEPKAVPKQEVKAEAVKQPVIEQKKEPAPASTSSGIQLQLGAFRSEAEAKTQWQKLQTANKDVLSGAGYNVVRADLKEKGIYYRLRASGFASSAAADKACKTLSGRKVGCFVVK